MIVNNVIDLIGNTPLVSLKETTGMSIFAKAEFLNPGGSIKDRVAKNMVLRAEEEGELKPGMTIIEPTSGNTGIGLSLVGVRRGYRVIIVMPENMSEERKKIIRCLGAELVLTPAELSIDGSVKRAEELLDEIGSGKAFIPQQFVNPNNPDIHYKTTGPEIFEQLNGKVDVFVSGLGSGGTLQGIGRYLKEKNPDLKLVAVEPKNALLGHEPGIHKIQGIGDGFVPDVLDTSLIDDIVEVTDEDAFATTRELASVQGLLCGTSSGANVWAAKQMAAKYGKDKIIATVMADRMERYFSTGLLDA